MVQGHTNAEIAQTMGFSANAIKSNVSSITEKLGASDRTQAAVYAVEVGLFTPRFRVPDTLPVSPR